MKNRYRYTLIKLKGWSLLMLLSLVATFPVQSLLQASVSKTSCQVEYINERLMVDVDNVALGPVLAAIREKTGIEYVLRSQE